MALTPSTVQTREEVKIISYLTRLRITGGGIIRKGTLAHSQASSPVGTPSLDDIARTFGSVHEAVARAGAVYCIHDSTCDDALVRALTILSQRHDGTLSPKIIDAGERAGNCASVATYKRRFGTLKKAAERAGVTWIE